MAASLAFSGVPFRMFLGIHRFSGQGKENGVTHIYKETYAAITPEGQVIAVSSSLKNLHTATGKVIPGYSALLAGAPDDEEVEE